MAGKIFAFSWEIPLIALFQRNLAGIAAIFSEIFAAFGSEVVLVGIILFVYLAYDKNVGRKIMINTIVGLEICSGIKNIFQRRRPYMDTDKVKCLLPVDKSADVNDIYAQGYSFPSLHTFNITCITVSLYKYFKKRVFLFIAIIVSFLVGLSRIITANHYPTDVIAGWILGLLAVEGINFLQEKIEKKKLYLLISIISLVGFLFCKSNDFFSSYGIIIGFFIADLFENKYVNFEKTDNLIRTIARIALAAVVFLSLCEGLKMIVPQSFQESATLLSYAFRSFRYAIGTFASCGLTPIVYKYNILKIK